MGFAAQAAETLKRCLLLRSRAVVRLPGFGFGCEFRSADQIAYLNAIICKEFLSSSPLRHEVFRMILPSVYRRQGIKLDECKTFAVLCREILNGKKPGHLAHNCHHLLE